MLAGVLLGGMAAIKVPLGLFGVYLLARGHVRAFLGFVGVIVGLGLISLLSYGWGLHEAWYGGCIETYASKSVSGNNVQSLTGFLARAAGGDILDWKPRPVEGDFALLVRSLSFVVVAMVVAVFIWAGRPRDHRELGLELGVLAVVILVISPLTWTHYYLFALFPLLLAVTGTIKLPEGRVWLVVTAGSGLLLSLPLVAFFFTQPWMSFIYNRILASYHFYGAVLFLAVLLAARIRQKSIR